MASLACIFTTSISARFQETRETKGQRIYLNSLFALFGADGVIVVFLVFLPPATFFCLSFGCVTASLHGVVRVGEVSEKRIPLVPPRPSDEMGFFSGHPFVPGSRQAGSTQD